MDFLGRTYLDNTVQAYLIALAVAIAIIVGVRIARVAVVRWLQRLAAHTRTNKDDLAVRALGNTRMLPVAIIGIYVGSLSLVLPENLARLLPMLAIASLMIQIGIWVTSFIKLNLEDYKDRRAATGDTSSVGTVQVVSVIARLALWVILLLIVLDNFGVDITALVAGLGIGGVAVALALQTILSDLFASVSITLDKPFEVGDFIIVGELLGTVEHIGVKTTRVRSLSGEQLVFANNDLLSSRIRNFKRMYERRVVFSIGVTYQTGADKAERIPGIMQEAIEAQTPVRFDRAHFKEYGDFALVYEAVFFVMSREFNVYMDAQQGINLAIMRRFEAEGIEFAYPTQTLYLNKVAEPA